MKTIVSAPSTPFSGLSQETRSMRLGLTNSLTFPLTRGTAEVIPADAMPLDLLAATDLSSQVCDHRYYDVVHRTLGHDFPLLYMLIRDREGNFRGAQPFFVVDQNILAGVQGRIADFAEKIREKHPRFLTLKTLMLGNPAGPGALGVLQNADTATRQWFSAMLAEALALYSKENKVRITVFKDFPADARAAMATLTDPDGKSASEFIRLPSMPMTCLQLSPFSSFDDYLARTLSKVTRKSMRRKLKKSEDENLQLTVTADVSDCIDDVYALYLQVYARAGLKFEKLTKDYFLQLGKLLPDRARFFLWRRQGKLIAMSATLVRFPDDTSGPSALYDLYLGLDYEVALDLHLYFLTMRDVMQWAIENKIATYYSTPLNYDAKLHFRHRLVPQDLYLRHTSPVLNPAFKFAMRFAEPTRHDKILQDFPNAHELKGD